MANHGSSKTIAVVIALVLVTSAHAQLFDQCIAYYNGLGGQEGVQQVNSQKLSAHRSLMRLLLLLANFWGR